MYLNDTKEFPGIFHWLDTLNEIAVDTETTGLDPYRAIAPNRICGVALTGRVNGEFESVYLPFRHALGKNLPLSDLYALTEYLTERGREGSLNTLYWNAKFDLHMLAVDGYEPPFSGGVEDFMIAAHLWNENEPSFGLKEFTDRYRIGRGSLDETALKEKVEETQKIRVSDKSWKGFIHCLDGEDVSDYATSDTELTYETALMLRPALDKYSLAALFQDYSDYLLLIWRMERNGVRLDVAKIKEHMRTLGPRKYETLEAILQAVKPLNNGSTLDPTPRDIKLGKRGTPLKQSPILQFNPLSPKQVIQLTGWPKTDVRFLEELDETDPLHSFGQMLLDYRVLSKMSGTYYDAYLELIDGEDTLRPNYNVHGTVSGRASCSKPNLQNVPRFTERRPVKDVFIPRDGFVFVEVDYEQAELRIATHYANEERMRDIFHQGRDPHTETAANMGVPRFIGKTLNFAVIYGAGVRGVMKTLKCTEDEARSYLKSYHGLYPGFRKFSDIMQHAASTKKIIQLPTGRTRRFDTYKRSIFEIDFHKAMNSFVQGTASEMLRVALQRVDARVRDEEIPARPLLQVHDSTLLEVRPEALDPLFVILREEMTDFDFDPAPDIEIKVGTSWARMEVVEDA